MSTGRLASFVRLAVLISLVGVASSAAGAQEASLQERWRAAIAETSFAEPVRVASEQRSYSVSGSVHARLPQPLPTLDEELTSAAAWCEILFLHLNVKACRADDEGGNATLRVHVGRKHYQSLQEAERLDLQFHVGARQPGYLAVALEGDRGPYDTRAFRLRLRAIPDGEEASLIELRYSLVYGTPARVALWAYFTFAGRDRVGFTVEGHDARGEPRYVGGMRGMIERNVMRFYLALAVHLAGREQRIETRLRRWFAATERYPQQLRELDEASYLEQKRRAHRRQQALHGE
ncbi:hypothetical protein LG302_03860 [Halomonas organivorans]